MHGFVGLNGRHAGLEMHDVAVKQSQALGGAMVEAFEGILGIFQLI